MVYTVDPILIAAAVIPAVFLMIRVYRSDRLEAEKFAGADAAAPEYG